MRKKSTKILGLTGLALLLGTALVSCNSNTSESENPTDSVVNPTDGAQKKITVSFNSTGGSKVDAQEILANSVVAKPADPTKEGYTFEGWYLNGVKFNFEEKLLNDCELEAHWIANKYSVSFNSNGGSKVETQSVSHNGKATKPIDPVFEGHTFMGWYLGNEPFDFNTKVTGAVELMAKWDLSVYTITFDSLGGTEVAKQSVKYKEKVVKPTDPTKTGYTFKGWYLNGELFDFNSEINNAFTLQAHWEANKLTVVFDTDGGNSIENQEVLYNNKVTRPENPVKDGFIFMGWYLNDELFDFNKEIKSSITLVAKWSTKKVIVSFDTAGGSEIESVTTAQNGSIVKPTNPTKPGYEFAGWYLDGELFDFNSTIKEDIELVAHWNIKDLHVIFYEEDGITIIEDKVVRYGEAVVAPTAPVKDNNDEDKNLYEYAFVGWDKDLPEAITADMKLVAKYEKTPVNYVYEFNFDHLNNNEFVIKGFVNRKYAGMTVEIFWEISNGVGNIANTSLVGNDGAFEARFNLDDLLISYVGTNKPIAYAHITIYNGDEVVYGGRGFNLGTTQYCTNTGWTEGGIEGTPYDRYIKSDYEDTSYYAGANGWDVLMLIAANDKINITYTEASLMEEQEKVYFVVNGAYSGITDRQLRFFFDLVHDNNIDGLGWNSYLARTSAADFISINKEAKTFTFKFEITGKISDDFLASNNQIWALLLHFGNNQVYGNAYCGGVGEVNRIANGDLIYKVRVDDDTFKMPAIVIEHASNFITADIKDVDGKAMVSVSGKKGSIASDYITAMAFKRNGVYNGDNNWAYAENQAVVYTETEDNFIITFDVTNLDAAAFILQYVFADKAADLKLRDSLEKSVTIGSKTYTVFSDVNGVDGSTHWGCLAVVVTNN